MKYTEPVYRPPYEANSLLLQVTVGCAHNKCTYCTMYRSVKFSTESIEQIEKDLKEAKRLIELVEVENISYLGIHAINTVPFDAVLPRDRERALETIDNAIEKMDEEFLNSVPQRHAI